MGLYRDESGLTFEVDDNYARTQGYTPVSIAEEDAGLEREAMQARGEERGLLGTANAALTGAASGLTLGLSDVLLAEVLTDDERERLMSDVETNPYARTGGEIVGAIGASVAAPGSALGRTPTGYLSRSVAGQVEQGVARGGLKGYGSAIGAMGAEGAVQSAGSYIGHSALADTEVTVEGLSGAIGTGFAFGSLGGGAALGVAKGTIAARRMFSRTMGGGKEAAKAAESAWSTQSQELLEADASTYALAKQRLEDMRLMEVEALKGKQQAKSTVREEQIRAQAYEAPPAYVPDAPQGLDADFVGPIPTPHGPNRPRFANLRAELGSNAPLPEAAPALPSYADVVDETVTTVPASALKEHGFESLSVPGKDKVKTDKARAAMTEGQRDPIKIAISPGGKYVLEDGTHRLAAAIEQGKPVKVQWFRGSKGLDEAPPSPYTVEGAGDSLEGLLAGTKAQVDGGAAFKDIKAPGAPTKAGSRSYAPEVGKMLDEKMASDAIYDSAKNQKFGEIPKPRMSSDEMARGMSSVEDALAMKGPVPPQYGPTGRAPFSNLRSQLGRAVGIRPQTAELLGEKMATEQARLLEVVSEYGAAREALESIAAKIDDAAPALGGRQQRAAEILDDAHEQALIRARFADDPIEAGQALQEADEIERMLEKLNAPAAAQTAPASFADDITKNVSIIERYEAASARMAEVVGDGAHPMSAEFSKALEESAKVGNGKVSARTARALEDAEEFGPWEQVGPKAKTPKERVTYAKERQLEADNAYTAVKNEQGDAKGAYDKAGEKVRAGEKAKREALKLDAKGARAASTGSKAATLGGAWEILDIPGMPKVSDLPVVGPLLGAWLKYRTLKAAMGRAMGRVPATADARVAAAAARTKDRIAKAIDKSLEIGTKAGRHAAKHTPKLAAIVANRIYDDGEEDAKKNATLQEQVAVRSRELAAYVHTPGAIERDVRRELAGVTDPDIIAGAEMQRRVMMEYLLKHAPKVPEQGMLQKQTMLPNPAQALSFARRMEAAHDPAAVYERIAQQRDLLTLEMAETLRVVYPQMFALAQQRLQQKAAEMQHEVPYRQRIQLSLLYKMPLDVALSADNLKITQSVYTRKPAMPPAGAPQPPMPSVAGETNMTALFQTTADRRAMR